MSSPSANLLAPPKKLLLAGVVFAAAGSVAIGLAYPSPSRAHSQQASPGDTATKFVLGDLKIESDIHNRDEVRDRIIKALKSREFDEHQELVDQAATSIRGDFQERGYFKVVVHDPVSQSLGLTAGKQRILITASITEGDQFRLRNLSIQSVAPEHPLTIPVATLREQFHLAKRDLFNMTEIRAGLERLQQLYVDRGYAAISAEPDTEIDNATHSIDLKLRVTEGPHTP
jgi:outer membrane protein assembly factor BamA